MSVDQPDIDVLVSEVGPRDGLQSVTAIMPTAAKKRWIDALASAGLREIEVGSFVPAKVLPHPANTAPAIMTSNTKATIFFINRELG